MALGLGAPALAQGAGQSAGSGDADRPVVVLGRWPAEGACTPQNTTSVAFADLLRDRASHIGQCIATAGWLSGRALFLNREDADLPNSNVNRAAADRRIGLYANVKAPTGIPTEPVSRVQIVGVLWDCSSLAGPNVAMVLGYCHYTGGLFIGVAEDQPVK